ncbi:hypothetical protein SAMN03159343_2790 [Klenkia marina]|uniref:Dolichyl-phosphate-mannose-protein mannosyltransferase n=1 Tax=Klenkia marina TaxID=1960309 RepID=A0A1G4YGN6_9ACTN|nr:hypothetical protein [Klenkia marina]SCX52509.1 hypothetical protein SAMN03159343_2790 [Klenkia marina]
MIDAPARAEGLVVRRLPAFALAAFLLLAVVVGVVASLAYPGRPELGLDGPWWLDALFQGDSGWYFSIASQGYSYTPGVQSPIAFFPAYPVTVHLLGELMGGDFSTAAGVLTLVFAGAVTVLFASWIRTRVAPRTAVVAVGLLLLYPYSFFLYGSGYSDALFLLTALGAFALLERRQYVLAGLVGILATAGRPIGIAVTAGLAVRALELLAQRRTAQHDPDPDPDPDRAGAGSPGRPVPLRALVAALRDVGWREVSLLVSVAGLVGWMVYLGERFGDPLAFATVQGAPGWNQGSGPFTWFKGPFVGSVLSLDWDVLVLIVPQALMCGLAVLLVRTCWKRFGWGYTAFAVVSIAIPIIGTKDFMGGGRYVLAAFPLLAAAAVVLTGDRRPRWLAPAVLAVLGVGLVIATVAYVHGVEVS